MADWRALDRVEQQDTIAYEISRQNDRNTEIGERLEDLRRVDAKWEGHVAALLIAIWKDLP